MLLSAFTDKQLAASQYLSGIADGYEKFDGLDELINKVSSASPEGLLALKAQFSLGITQTEFSNFDDLGQIWSDFAVATIDRALEIAWKDAAKRHKLALHDGAVPGLFILGLGKLGGHDLNFSSDVDLIAFFDAETLPIPEHKGQAFIASDICKRVTQILQPRNSPDFIWRVDWRLRPESSGTGLAMNTAKAETFYFFRSLPWHRLALMKARPVAGDLKAGLAFLIKLEPYIWRRNLDFTTLDELAALKTRINNEHPGLKHERSAPAPITENAAGFNLKLGRGGIREIEFIANAQQLIHGGKRPSLRTTHTRTALSNLADLDLLSVEDANKLKDDYSYFRQIENAVQMLANEQTHIVPSDEDLECVLTLLRHPVDFDETIFERRHRVHSIFAKLFAESSSQDAETDLTSLEGASLKIASSWKNGFQEHGISISNQNKYKELGNRLASRLMSQPRAAQAFERVDAFLRQIARSESYFALLNRHENLLDKLITPLLHSPHMSELLRQSPHIIDIFISENTENLEDQSKFVLTSPDYEHRLESLRRFVNEQLFLNYSQFMDRSVSVETTQAALTAVAEQTLNLAIQIVHEDLGLSDDVSMTVLGLGKMGTRAMAPQSDLDLIFIFPDEIESELATKIVGRLRTTLTVKLREGIAYDLDMRLRPSGRSGPPAVKLASFREHHMSRAHSWEHIALAPARIVAGDKSLGDKVMEVKSEIFSRPRDEQAFRADAWAMYQRLKEERLQDTPIDVWRSKLRTGGGMAADYIAACQTVIGEPRNPLLIKAQSQWNELMMWERLLGLKGKPFDHTPSRFFEDAFLNDLKQRQKNLENNVNQEVSSFFKSVNPNDPSSMGPVKWS